MITLRNWVSPIRCSRPSSIMAPFNAAIARPNKSWLRLPDLQVSVLARAGYDRWHKTGLPIGSFLLDKVENAEQLAA